MGEPARKRATYEDLFDLPEYVNGEIIDGELYVSPRPAARHARTGTRMGMDVGPPIDGDPEGPDRPGGWWILFEPELHFGEDVLIPDLAGWRRERMPVIPDVAYFILAPDWVCEVLSPSTEKLDRIQKMRVYAREGVRWLWLANPILKTLEVYEQVEGRWVLLASHAGDERIRAVPFDAVELSLARWWILDPT